MYEIYRQTNRGTYQSWTRQTGLHPVLEIHHKERNAQLMDNKELNRALQLEQIRLLCEKRMEEILDLCVKENDQYKYASEEMNLFKILELNINALRNHH